MPSVNKVFQMGNLTREPELRYTPSGAAVCNFSIAVNQKYTSNGEQKEEVSFFEIQVWGKQAESCSKYLAKGSSAFIEGRLKQETWQDKDTGQNRSKIIIVAERVQFMSKPQESTQQANSAPPQNNQYPKSEAPGYTGN